MYFETLLEVLKLTPGWIQPVVFLPEKNAVSPLFWIMGSVLINSRRNRGVIKTGTGQDWVKNLAGSNTLHFSHKKKIKITAVPVQFNKCTFFSHSKRKKEIFNHLRKNPIIQIKPKVKTISRGKDLGETAFPYGLPRYMPNPSCFQTAALPAPVPFIITVLSSFLLVF